MTDQMTTPELVGDQLARFKRDGFIHPIKIYEEDEIKRLWSSERLRLLDRSKAVYPDDATAGNTNISNYDRHLDSSFLADHVCRPKIVGRVRSVLGPDVLCWRSEFFPKYSGDEGTDWHQADTFANASGQPQIVWSDEVEGFAGTITVWTAFTDSRIDNGCLQFIPGTHDQMFYDESLGMDYDATSINQVDKSGTNRGFFGYDYRQLQIDPEWEPDELSSVSIELKAGEAVMFWSTLMHASHPHSGVDSEMRLGFVSRYVPTVVRIYPDTDVVEEYGSRVSLDDYGAVLVSGQDNEGHNRLRTETTRGHRFRCLP